MDSDTTTKEVHEIKRFKIIEKPTSVVDSLIVNMSLFNWISTVVICAWATCFWYRETYDDSLTSEGSNYMIMHLNFTSFSVGESVTTFYLDLQQYNYTLYEWNDPEYSAIVTLSMVCSNGDFTCPLFRDNNWVFDPCTNPKNMFITATNSYTCASILATRNKFSSNLVWKMFGCSIFGTVVSTCGLVYYVTFCFSWNVSSYYPKTTINKTNRKTNLYGLGVAVCWLLYSVFLIAHYLSYLDN